MTKKPERPTPIRIDLRARGGSAPGARAPAGGSARATVGLIKRVRAALARFLARLPWRVRPATGAVLRAGGRGRVRLPTRAAETSARRVLGASRLRVAPVTALRNRLTSVVHRLRLTLPRPLRVLPAVLLRPFARVPTSLRARLGPRGAVDPVRILWIVIGGVVLCVVAIVAYGIRAEAGWRNEAFGAPQYVFVGAAELDRLRTLDAVAEERFTWPLEMVGRVTSCFGPRNLVGALAHHQGLDVAAPQGTPVLASKTGVVKHYLVSTAPTGYGTRVLLSHPDGTHTLYAHLQPRLELVVGQTLRQGAIVGYSGNTGFSTGPHLHFEILDGQGRAVDPARFITARLGAPIFREDDHTCWPTGVLAWRR
jgi:hypothetical protein